MSLELSLTFGKKGSSNYSLSGIDMVYDLPADSDYDYYGKAINQSINQSTYCRTGFDSNRNVSVSFTIMKK